jgi:NADH dehydrogenase [ubiquinone] 1 alpha subcomplex assembly factor 5
MESQTPAPQIFDCRCRQALRERAGRRAGRCKLLGQGADNFLWQHIAEDLADRLAYVTRDFRDVLIIGPMTAYADLILGDRTASRTLATLSQSEATTDACVVIQEDALPFDPESFDLIITAGTLDSVNDLPGALVQIRRCLKPDGLMLGSMFGAGTLMRLKGAMMIADGDRAIPHIHPQIDLRSAADLLTRAGFTLPVADQDTMPVRYSSIARLISDVRDMGVGNALSGQRPYFGKAAFSRLVSVWADMADVEGKVEEQFTLIHISGWAPSTDQPKPARRGSGTVSLASILKPPGD